MRGAVRREVILTTIQAHICAGHLACRPCFVTCSSFKPRAMRPGISPRSSRPLCAGSMAWEWTCSGATLRGAIGLKSVLPPNASSSPTCTSALPRTP